MTTAADTSQGVILAECRELLAALADRHGDDPQAEHRRLAMLALEREQLVSYAYRQDVLGKRMQDLNLPPDVLTVLRHAFTQVWRDEEAHTILIKGTLLERGSAGAGLLRTTVEQTAGWLSGWSSALKHHVPRSAAPLRNTVVDGLATAARVVGKLSPELRAELHHKSFRDFCRYNIDAEQTAELCWARLAELERRIGGPDHLVFERIAREERHHCDIFAAAADALDDADRLIPGATAEKLTSEFARVDARFVLPDRRGRSAPAPEPAVHVFDRADTSRHAAIAAAIDLLGDVADKQIVIQASWMLGYSRSDSSSIVDPALLRTAVTELRGRGATAVVVDGPNLYSNLFDNRDVATVAEHFGIDPGCAVEDGTGQVCPLDSEAILGPTHISRRWVEADKRISIAPLRGHPLEHIHGATANLESLVPGAAERVFFRRRYDHSVSALAVLLEKPPDLAIVDAWQDCADGLFGVMAGRRLVSPGRLYASTDTLACDLVVLRHTGSDEEVASPTLRRAMEWLGDPRGRVIVRGVDAPIRAWRHPYRNPLSTLIADLSFPVFAYLSGSGSIFAPEMDPIFAERRPPPLPLRGVRALARLVFGLRPARR